MPRTCTLCSHPDIDDLNKSICNSVSYRNIALRASTSATSVKRHIETCLQLEMSAVRIESKLEQSFDFETEIVRLYGKSLKMFNALEKWLSDPDSPDEFDIGPRDAEVLVTFLDYNDVSEQTGKPARKKAMLADLLKRAEAPNNIEAMGLSSTAVDNRKLYLEALKTLNDRLEQMAKFYGLFKKDAENPNTIKDAEAAYRDVIAQVERQQSTFDEMLALVGNNKPLKTLILANYPQVPVDLLPQVERAFNIVGKLEGVIGATDAVN